MADFRLTDEEMQSLADYLRARERRDRMDDEALLESVRPVLHLIASERAGHSRLRKFRQLLRAKMEDEHGAA